MPRAKPVVVHEDELPYEQWQDSAAELRWRTLLSGDRTPTNTLTLGVAEVAPGRTREFRPHRHAQPELYYILEGEGVVMVDGEKSRVRAGSAVFIPSMVSHCAVNTGTSTMRLLYVFATDSFDDVVYEFEAPVPIVEPDPSQ